MKSQQIEYTSDTDAIMIRIPKGLSEGKPVMAGHPATMVGRQAPMLERQALGKILHAIHRSATANRCPASGAPSSLLERGLQILRVELS